MQGYIIYLIITSICAALLLIGLSKSDQWENVKTYLGFPFVGLFVLWFTAPILCAIFIYAQIFAYFENKQKHS